MSDSHGEVAPGQIGRKIAASGLILVVLAVLSFMTALFMNNQDGKQYNETLPPTGGQIGPFEFETNQVLDVEVRQALKQEGWSFVDAELQSEDEEYLFGFGEELWWETGVDSEGYSWNESVKMYDTKLTIPEQGSYYFEFAVEFGLKPGRGPYGAAEGGPPAEEALSDITVRITPKKGSTLPHLMLGIVFLLGGVVLVAVGFSRFQRDQLAARLAE